jgi:hypothetical protein
MIEPISYQRIPGKKTLALRRLKRKVKKHINENEHIYKKQYFGKNFWLLLIITIGVIFLVIIVFVIARHVAKL